MNWVWSILISVLLMGLGLYFDPTSGTGHQLGLLLCLAFGLAGTLMAALPLYIFADVVQKKWRWPLWIQPVMVAGIWLAVVTGFWILDPKGSGIPTFGTVLKVSLLYWICFGLPFGVPWIALGYRDFRRDSLKK